MNTIDPCDIIATSIISFVLNPSLWEQANKTTLLNAQTGWNEVKFLNDDGSQLNNDMSTIPNDTGGIYVFVIKPVIIPETHLYIMYIGRAKITPTQNLRKRCREYIKEERPKISRLVRTWGKFLYIKYLPLSDNNMIDQIEAELINVIVPPCNELIPNKKIQAAVDAFSL